MSASEPRTVTMMIGILDTAHLAACLNAISEGNVGVQQDQIRMVAHEQRHRLHAIAGLHNSISLCPQNASQHLTITGFVIHHQDRGGTGCC